MARYSRPTRTEPEPVEQTHAVWRGIGCLFAIIIPAISWLLATLTVSTALGAGWPLPYQLLGYPVLPDGLWGWRPLWPILAFIVRQQHLYLHLVLTVAYVVLIAALMSSVYSIVYRFVGPPRYGPYDLPQPKIKVGRYKR